MTKDIKKYFKGSILIKALLMNFFAFIIAQIFFEPKFETNDDNYISSILYGVYGEYDTHLVYMNVLMGKIIKAFLIICPTLPWYTIIQYSLLFVAFIVVLYIILSNEENEYRYLISWTLLLFFGYECYVKVQYSKTAGVITVAGILLIYETLRLRKIERIKLLIGIILTILGSLYRFQVFLMMLPIIGITVLLYAFNEVRKGNYTVFKRCCIVFIPLFLICFGLNMYDSYVYEESIEWKEYKEFDEKRIELLDYGFPDYDDNKDVYQRLQISRSDLDLYKNWNFADKELFTEETLDSLINSKEEKTLDLVTIKSFLNEFPVKYFEYSYFWGVCILLLLWGIGAKKNKIAVILTLIVCMAIELYFYYTGRYFINRIDVPVMFGVCIVLALYIEKNRFYSVNKCIIIFIVAGVVFNTNMFLTESTELEDKESAREVFELIENDKETMYLVENYTSNELWTTAFSVWDIPPKGCSENYYTLGGWRYNTPLTNYQLQCYGLENPYKDVVNNENAYIICDNAHIWQMEKHIREKYFPTAKVQLEKVIHGHKIYKIYTELEKPDIKTAKLFGDNGIYCKYSIEQDESWKEILQGYVYQEGADPFKQKVYIGKFDSERQTEIIYPAVLDVKSVNNDIDQGKYSWFSISLEEMEITGIQKEELRIYLETDNELYVQEINTSELD